MSTVPSPLPRGLLLALHRMENGGHLALGWQMCGETHLPLCVCGDQRSSPRFAKRVRVCPWTRDRYSAEMPSGTHRCDDPLGKHTNRLRQVWLSCQLHVKVTSGLWLQPFTVPSRGFYSFFYLQTHHGGLSRNKGAAAEAADLALGSERAIHTWHQHDRLLVLQTPVMILLPHSVHGSRTSAFQAFWRYRATTLIQKLPFMGTHSVSRALNTLFYG